jgi:hypothetical protein
MDTKGKDVRERGFFYLPFKYVKKFATELLVINDVNYI